MFAAVSCLLTVAARRAPMVLVLDDLHWAPKPTLLLLRHLLGSLVGAPIMMIASYRDSEVYRDHPLADAVGELRGGPAVTNIVLQGLDAAGVTSYVEAAAGHRLDRREMDLARVLYNETEGNPFFLGQLLRHLVESGAIVRQEDRWVWQADIEDLTVPDGVREIVRRRLSRLSDATNRTLIVAAVIGREFSLDVLEHIEGLGDRLALLDAVDPAVQARLVMEVGAIAGWYSFSHALVPSHPLRRTNRRSAGLDASEGRRGDGEEPRRDRGQAGLAGTSLLYRCDPGQHVEGGRLLLSGRTSVP
jgi:hypothetical protein